MQTYTDIDAYITTFPTEVQEILEQMQLTIKIAAPGAVEKISYGMPAFALNGILVFFAAHKNHIGFYPTGAGIKAFQKEISHFKNSKGAVQFPIGQPLPLDLITEITKFRVNENQKNRIIKSSKILKINN